MDPDTLELAKKMPTGLIIKRNETVHYNNRFPNQNQTKHCWAQYVEYQRCAHLNPDDEEKCKPFRLSAQSICPGNWIETWDEQVQEKRFPGQEVWLNNFQTWEKTKHLHH